jgi:nitrate/nitrite-specific signal transduction histidine kinase
VYGEANHTPYLHNRMRTIDFLRLPLSKTGARKRNFEQFLGRLGTYTITSLRVKIVSLVVLISLFAIVSVSLLIYRYQHHQLIENASTSAAMLNDTIEISLHHAFITNDFEMADELVQAYTAQSEMGLLRILNNNAVTIISSQKIENGIQYDLSHPICANCHTGNEPPNQQTAIYNKGSGEQVFIDINLLHNEADCQACHAPEHKILGLLMLEMPLTEMQNQIENTSWRTGAFSAAGVILLLGLMLPMLNRAVLHPVESLSRQVRKISQGDLNSPVGAAKNDELGILASSLESMRLQLKMMYQEMEKREKEALTLFELGTKISASLALDEVLTAVAEAARQLFSADIGMVGLVDEASGDIVIEAAAGTNSSRYKGERLSLESYTSESMRVEGRSVTAEVYDPAMSDPVAQSLFEDGYIASFLAVPLKRGDNLLGVLEVLSHEPRRFVTEDAHLLLRLANQVEVSIENAKLHRQFRYLAILEERNRLAREMHDQLAQTLGYLNVKASMTEDLLRLGSIEQVQESLTEMKRVTRNVYTDVRESIFNLRSSISSEMEFLPALKQYLQEYQAAYRLKVLLAVGSDELGNISQEAASQALFIVQEALANVRKHSQATQVWIHIVMEEEHVRISIEDNGVGFEQEHRNGQTYGLQIMYERAETVGGSLDLYSQPGHGTRIDVRVPCVRHFDYR